VAASHSPMGTKFTFSYSPLSLSRWWRELHHIFWRDFRETMCRILDF
jgi:hypothetical protein